jgi:threonine dehydrogenase-like Zn-dependent dehydrogenase
MPDGTSRFRIGKEPIRHYMGCSTFSNHTVLPEIALAKVREDAPFDKICYIGCGVTTGLGAVIYTAKVWPGANVAVFGLGGIGLNVIQGARMVGADKIIGIDVNPAREAMARKFGMTHFINPKQVDNVVDAVVQLTDGGADYSFECIGNTTTMRQALECCHKGWGQSVIIGVAAAGDAGIARAGIGRDQHHAVLRGPALRTGRDHEGLFGPGQPGQIEQHRHQLPLLLRRMEDREAHRQAGLARVMSVERLHAAEAGVFADDVEHRASPQ